jgi:hypothetical protein
VVDAVRKPFLPEELRDAVKRALARATSGHEDALEYAAAIELAVERIERGELEGAEHALARARATNAFDADVMSLSSLVAELRGDDEDASRGYRATIALMVSPETPVVEPFAGLERLATYAGNAAARDAEALRKLARGVGGEIGNRGADADEGGDGDGIGNGNARGRT